MLRYLDTAKLDLWENILTTAKKKTSKKTSKRRSSTPINTPDNYVFGRPSEYNEDYPRKVYEACVKGECVTVASICVLLDICRETYHDWQRKYPKFSDAIKKGTEHRKLRMEQSGLNGMSRGKDFNAVPWLFLMKNMFPDEYRDKREIEVDDKNPSKKISPKFGFSMSESPDEVDKRGGDEVESD